MRAVLRRGSGRRNHWTSGRINACLAPFLLRNSSSSWCGSQESFSILTTVWTRNVLWRPNEKPCLRMGVAAKNITFRGAQLICVALKQLICIRLVLEFCFPSNYDSSFLDVLSCGRWKTERLFLHSSCPPPVLSIHSSYFQLHYPASWSFPSSLRYKKHWKCWYDNTRPIHFVSSALANLVWLKLLNEV